MFFHYFYEINAGALIWLDQVERAKSTDIDYCKRNIRPTAIECKKEDKNTF